MEVYFKSNVQILAIGGCFLLELKIGVVINGWIKQMGNIHNFCIHSDADYWMDLAGYLYSKFID